MRRKLVAVAAVALTALPAAAAFAHQGDPNYRSYVRNITPKTDGLKAEVLNYDDRLVVTNRSGKTVVIEGYSQEPYARLLPDGTVQVNMRSRATYLNEERFGEGVDVPDDVSAAAPPRWRTLSGNGTIEFHDHRIHWMAKTRPPMIEDPSKRTKVFDWEVPITVDGRKGAIAGDLWWVAREGEGGPPKAAIVALGGIVVAGAGAVAVKRRRRNGSLVAADERDEAW